MRVCVCLCVFVRERERERERERDRGEGATREAIPFCITHRDMEFVANANVQNEGKEQENRLNWIFNN